METIINGFKEFLNLTPKQKVNLFYALIIFGLCYIIYYRETTWKNDYTILNNRYDTISFFYQRKINDIQEKRQVEMQGYNDKLENLYKANEKIKNEIE